MSSVHLHLLLNHVPVLGAAFATFLLALAMLKRSDELKRVSFGAFVMAALIAIPVYLTGEPAAEMVEKLPGVFKAVIDRHEDAALAALIILSTLGVAAIAGLVLFRRNRKIPLRFSSFALLLSLAAGGTMAWTANLGGQVRQGEIRDESVSAPPPGERQNNAEKHGAKDKADDHDSK